MDIKNQSIINYIFSLPNRQEFQVIEEEFDLGALQKLRQETTIEENKKIIFKKKPGRPKKGK